MGICAHTTHESIQQAKTLPPSTLWQAVGHDPAIQPGLRENSQISNVYPAIAIPIVLQTCVIHTEGPTRDLVVEAADFHTVESKIVHRHVVDCPAEEVIMIDSLVLTGSDLKGLLGVRTVKACVIYCRKLTVYV